MIITRTPFRISLAGGGSDLPDYYRRHGGAVLSFAIDKYMYLSMHPNFRRHGFLLKYSQVENVDTVEEIRHRVIRQVFADYGINGVDFNSAADVPAGTGLGSSSAFTVGLALLCDVFTGRRRTNDELAAYACRVEIEKLGDPIGKQDQYACAHGGINFIRFSPDDSVRVEKVFLPPDRAAVLESNLAMFYTGVTRSAGAILAGQKRNMTSGGDEVKAVSRLVDLAGELEKELHRGNVDAVGDVLDRGWRYKKEMASGISNPAIDELHARAMRAGAAGGKLLGAGGGGFLLFYAPDGRMEAVRRELADLPELPFRLEKSGAALAFYD